MAHPFASHREDKVQRSRVDRISKGYASGGGVKHSDAAQDATMIAKAVHKHEKHMHKGEPETKLGKARLDRYARGGKVKPKGSTTVNVVIAPQGGAEKPPGDLPPLGAGAPPTPPVAAMPPPPPVAPPMKPPMPPGMPMRASGGRVTDGPAWKEGLKNGTAVQHTDGKNDGSDIYRGRQVTYKRGGAVEAPKGTGGGPKLPGGDNGKGRLAKAALQRRSKLP